METKMNNILRDALIDMSSNLVNAGELGRAALIDAALEETDKQEKRIKELEKALKQSAESFHRAGLMTGRGHASGNFTKCPNGWCMEAAEALNRK